MKYLLVVVCMAGLAGCASQHPKIAHEPIVDCNPEFTNAPCLAPAHLHCRADNSCEWEQDWYPSQLTPAGCLVHTIATFGHVAQECRKNARHGRWIWRKDKSRDNPSPQN